MSQDGPIGGRRFYRDRDRGMIAGVCAGLADYFGFNLRVTRILAFVALVLATPAAILVYLGVVLLVPPGPRKQARPDYDQAFRKAVRSDPRQTMIEVGRRYRRMESRLARLERYVTSPRFDLDQEFRKL